MNQVECELHKALFCYEKDILSDPHGLKHSYVKAFVFESCEMIECEGELIPKGIEGGYTVFNKGSKRFVILRADWNEDIPMKDQGMLCIWMTEEDGLILYEAMIVGQWRDKEYPDKGLYSIVGKMAI